MDGERILSFADAVACVREQAERAAASAIETVELAEALGRVLACDVLADRDFPPFARSTRDGFALGADAGGGRYRVVGEVRAGERWAGKALAAGECVAIMTGAPVPPGADRVAMLEHVHQRGDWISFLKGRSVAAGENIVAPGSEAARGSTVVVAGVRMGAAHLGMAAACGCSELVVHARPRVAVLATGDELVELDEKPGAEQIRNSNSYALAGAVRRAGGHPVVIGIARDTVASLEERLQEAFQCELVLVAGGVSAGKYDLAEQVLREKFGAEFLFTGVRMQPGKPVVFGRSGAGKHFFGLPGNPVSALVTFGLLAARMVAAMGGELGWEPRILQAVLEEDLAAAALTRVLPARINYSAGRATVQRIPWQGSGDMAALAAANGFIFSGEDDGPLRKGDAVRVWVKD